MMFQAARRTVSQDISGLRMATSVYLTVMMDGLNIPTLMDFLLVRSNVLVPLQSGLLSRRNVFHNVLLIGQQSLSSEERSARSLVTVINTFGLVLLDRQDVLINVLKVGCQAVMNVELPLVFLSVLKKKTCIIPFKALVDLTVHLELAPDSSMKLLVAKRTVTQAISGLRLAINVFLNALMDGLIILTQMESMLAKSNVLVTPQSGLLN
jgi:hypothetical protein